MIKLTKKLAQFEEAVCNSVAEYAINLIEVSEAHQIKLNSVQENESESFTNYIDKLADKKSLVVLKNKKDEHARILIFDPINVQDEVSQSFIIIDINLPNRQSEVISKNRVKNKVPLVKKIFFIPYNTPAFFTVLGPEGVGKTTLCGNIEKIFQSYPVTLTQFHHTDAWKGKDEKNINSVIAKNDKTKSLENVVNRSLLYRITRSVWRSCVPQQLKNQLLPVPGELRYMVKVISLLVDAHDNRNMVLTDRYCYDRLVRWTNLKRPFLHRVITYIICYMMRRPFHAFVLCDEPENIYKRKQAMPIWEMSLHQEMLIKTCKRFNVDHQIIDVSKMPEEKLSKYVTSEMLRRSQKYIFEMLEENPIT